MVIKNTKLYLNRTYFTENEAAQYGGAISFTITEDFRNSDLLKFILYLQITSIMNNKAHCGGGIHMDWNDLSLSASYLDNVIIVNNSATLNGQNIYTLNHKMRIKQIKSGLVIPNILQSSTPYQFSNAISGLLGNNSFEISLYGNDNTLIVEDPRNPIFIKV